MAPLFTGFKFGFGGGEFTKKVVPVRFYVDLYGNKGSDYGVNNSGSPPADDSQRFGGNGGYTRIDMTVPTAYILDINSPVSSYPGGPVSSGTGGQFGGSSVGFSINGQWMAITGGGGGAAGAYSVNYSFSPAFLFISTGPAGGAGGGAISAGPPGGSSGSAGGAASSSATNPSPTAISASLAGSGGGGAPGGGGGSGQQAGGGGGANIRVKFETNGLSGPLSPIGFPDITMSYVTGTDGGNPRGSGGRVIITNFNTNNSHTTSTPSVPVEFIQSL